MSSTTDGQKRRKRKRVKRICQAKLHSVLWSDIDVFLETKPGPGYCLDHIIPLHHPKVSGLHIPINFQWLTLRENNRKANKFDGTYENNSWRKPRARKQ